MGIYDIFRAYKNKAENEDLKKMLTPEMQEAAHIQAYLRELKSDSEKLDKQLFQKQKELEEISCKIDEKKKSLIILEDELLYQDFGLYKPTYDFTTSEEYNSRLKSIRDKQKQCIKNGLATSGNMNWTVNGSTAQGNKMVRDMQKLLLRAFNSECDELVEKVKYNNFDSYLKRMNSSVAAISKLGSVMSISISGAYLKLKVEELRLALEYRIKKQEEKEALKEARAEMRETARLQKELDEQRKKVEKEQAHYQKALIQTLKQLESADDSMKASLLEKKLELENQLQIIDTTLADLDYREANQRAGYVYIISNIGSFGENVYKIGMTRRLDPQERIDELGDASVPFNFDVHAMIFSDDAPALEAALHKAFESRKVNMVNQRREFFNVTLDEIKEVVKKNFDKTVEFIDIPDAEQYRISQRLKIKA